MHIRTSSYWQQPASEPAARPGHHNQFQGRPGRITAALALAPRRPGAGPGGPRAGPRLGHNIEPMATDRPVKSCPGRVQCRGHTLARSFGGHQLHFKFSESRLGTA